TAGGTTFGPYLMRVDLQRSSVQNTVGFAGVGVASVSGEVLLGVDTRYLATVAGGIAVTLNYRPTNRKASVQQAGVPAGWVVASSSQAPWTMLHRLSRDRIELTEASGEVVPFRQSSPGAWVADWGAGQSWPSGQHATVAQDPSRPDAQFQVTDRSGKTTTFPDVAVGGRQFPTSSWSAKNPAAQSGYDASGRLTAITDPVSRRSVTLSYGGSGACPSAAGNGLITAPKGMLCAIAGWDGQVTQVLYAERAGAPVIARIVTDAQAGGSGLSQYDIGYDAAGRPDRLRSPLANAAIAAGVLPGIGPADAADGVVLTSIAYDGSGRVATITQPSAMRSGTQGTPPERVARTFSYPQPGAIVVSEPGRDAPLTQATASPQTMLTTRTVDSVGRITESSWDAARQVPTGSTAPGGYVTRYAYDAQGNLASTTGPSVDPGADGAPRTTYLYDTRPGTGTGAPPVPIKGLQATYWQGGDFRGAPTGASAGPQINGKDPGSLAIRWPASPVGAGVFSARLEGLIVVPEGGVSQIINTVASSQVWVDGIRCTRECPSQLGLASRKPGSALQVRVDVRSNAAGVATMGVSWTTPSGTGVIPASALRPGLPQPTATTVRDQLTPGGSIVPLTTQLLYSPSDPQQVIRARSASGKVATREYESYDPGAGRFGRATGFTSAARDATATDYYGEGEAPATSCTGAAANQGGRGKSRTTAGGLRIAAAYDATGNVVGQTATGQPETCIRYDDAGLPVATTTAGMSITTQYQVEANPLFERRTVTQDGEVRTISRVVDLMGRPVHETDVWGTVTTTSYDSEDRPVQSVITTAAGARITMAYAYTADGQLQMISRDGQVLAEVGYDDATGRLSGVKYGNGSSLTCTRDSTGNPESRTLDVGGTSITEQVSLSPAGRTMRRQIEGAGANATWAYSYDRDGRLVAASLSGEASRGAPTGTWTYELNAASERMRITSPLTPAGGYTYSYAPSGRMRSTSDPRFASGFTYDDAGRATQAGPLSFSYDVSGLAARISDGAVTERRLIAGSAVIGSSIETATGTETVRYSSEGLILTPAGRISSQLVSLPGGVGVQMPPPAEEASTGGTTTSPEAPPDTAKAQPLPIWRMADLQGSVAWTSSGDSPPSDTTLYDPDGNRLGNAPPLSTDPSRPNLLFEGAATTPVSIPVSQLGARSYVPALGIFLQPDPMPNGSTTAYNYAAGDPINATDTTGASVVEGTWWKENWTHVAGVAAGVIVGFAVGAVTAGAGSTIAAAVAYGMVGGALGGAAGDYATQTTTNLLEGQGWESFTDVDVNQILISTAVGAVLGGLGGGARAYRAGLPRWGDDVAVTVKTPYGSFRFYGNTGMKAANESVKWAYPRHGLVTTDLYAKDGFKRLLQVGGEAADNPLVGRNLLSGKANNWTFTLDTPTAHQKRGLERGILEIGPGGGVYLSSPPSRRFSW
ncbi:MAG: RHS repeat-associated core domain-containing protein, partial [Miltoncostaeaceae bacterium]